MSVEQNLLFAVLAFEDELIDLQQLTSACRAWASDKSKSLADQLVERGWVTADHRRFLEDKAERKLAKHQNDPRVTLNAATHGDVCDALMKEVDDSDVRQSLSSWPSAAPVLVETLMDSGQAPSRYTWISQVGAGGLGQVWLAKDNNLSREVAVKEIKSGSASDEAVRRLIKEAQITGQLQHPGIVPVYEVNHEGRPFYTMKLVKGQTLSQAIREYHETKQAGNEDSLSERRLISSFLNVCDAIAYAHSRGVIHRDLKPDNIVLGEYGEAIVLDWGLARQVNSDDEDSAPIVVTDEAQTNATQAGEKMGTPAYMAPEQASGRVEHMDERTDIYGLGAILFEILSGQPPHRVQENADPASTSTRVGGPQPQSPIAALLHHITTGETPRVHSIDQVIPDELDAICATAMAKHRDERYQTAKELKAALLEFQVHEESIELASRAVDDLVTARQSGDYDDFSRARFGFETALERWPENARAAAGLKETRQDYACTAFDRGDFDLAMTLLDADAPDHVALITSIQAAASERASRTGRIRRLRRFGVVASLMIAVLASVATVWINSEREKAVMAQTEEAIQRRIAEQRAFNSDMALIQREWDGTNLYELRKILARYRKRKDHRGFEWHYWNRLANSELLTRAVQSSVTFSPDGLKWATMSADKTIKVWDAITGDEAITLKGHSDSISSVVFSPDGLKLASTSGDTTVKVWDATTGDRTLTLKGHTDSVSSIVFSPDGSKLGSASADKTIKVWDATTGDEAITLKGHSDFVSSVVFSPDGLKLASTSGDKTMKVWDATAGQVAFSIEARIGQYQSVTFSPDGEQLAAVWREDALDSRHVKVWDARTGNEIHTFKGHGGTLSGVVFSPDGSKLASTSRDKTVKVWDTTTGQEVFTLKGHMSYVSSIVFSIDGLKLASASWDKTVKVWDATTGQEMFTLKGHSAYVKNVVFSSDGTRVVTASADNTVKVWDVGRWNLRLAHRPAKEKMFTPSGILESGQNSSSEVKTGQATATDQEALTLIGHTGSVTRTSFSPDGNLLASASRDKTVKVWDTASGQMRLTIPNATAHSASDNHSLFISPDETQLVLVNYGTVRFWNINSAKESLAIKAKAGLHFHSVVFSPDGTALATAEGDLDKSGEVRVWTATTGQEKCACDGHTDIVESVVFSPDGTKLASASRDATVKIWDAASGKELLTFKEHTGSVTSVVFSPDGTMLASASHDRTVRFWDSATGKEVHGRKKLLDSAESVSFSPDGKWLVAENGSGTVKVWNVATGRETLLDRSLFLNSVAVSPDTTRLASAGGFSDNTVKVWDTTTGQETLTLKGHAAGVNSVSFSSDGTRLASASFDNTVRIWDARPWTPELRAESQARGYLTVHRNRVESLEGLQAYIRSDKTISDSVRQQCLDWAELFWKNREPRNEAGDAP